MATWLLEHWTAVTAAATALGGVLLRRQPGKAWLMARITVELDLIECQRRNAHREALLVDLLAEIEWYRHLRGGSASSNTPTTPPATTSPPPSLPPNGTSAS